MAKFPITKHTDMVAEIRDEALDISIGAVESHPGDLQKVTQVRSTALHALATFADRWRADG